MPGWGAFQGDVYKGAVELRAHHPCSSCEDPE